MAGETTELEKAQAEQADPGTHPGAKPNPDGAGNGEAAGGKKEGAPKDGSERHFDRLRREMRELKKGMEERDRKIVEYDARINTLLDIVERRQQSAAPEAPEDPLAHLSPDDPDLPTLRKLVPALKRGPKGKDPEVESLKAAIEELKKDRETEKAGRSKVAEFEQVIGEIAEDRELSAEVAAAVRETILQNRVGGRTYEEAFDNALVYLRGSGTFPGKKPGKKEGEEPASVGGVMPGQAGSPVPSEDFRTLRKAWHEARTGDNAGAEASSFHAMLLKAQQEQARSG